MGTCCGEKLWGHNLGANCNCADSGPVYLPVPSPVPSSSGYVSWGQYQLASGHNQEKALERVRGWKGGRKRCSSSSSFLLCVHLWQQPSLSHGSRSGATHVPWSQPPQGTLAPRGVVAVGSFWVANFKVPSPSPGSSDSYLPCVTLSMPRIYSAENTRSVFCCPARPTS